MMRMTPLKLWSYTSALISTVMCVTAATVYVCYDTAVGSPLLNTVLAWAIVSWGAVGLAYLRDLFRERLESFEFELARANAAAAKAREPRQAGTARND